MAKLDRLGPALRTLRREARNLTLQALGERAGVDSSDLSKYEREERRPDLYTLEKILEGLGLRLLDLGLELDRQQKLAAGEVIPFPAPQPSPDELERRMREIAREETRAALGILAVSPGIDLQKFAEFVRSEGVEPNLESVDVLRSLLRRGREGGGEG